MSRRRAASITAANARELEEMAEMIKKKEAEEQAGEVKTQFEVVRYGKFVLLTALIFHSLADESDRNSFDPVENLFISEPRPRNIRVRKLQRVESSSALDIDPPSRPTSAMLPSRPSESNIATDIPPRPSSANLPSRPVSTVEPVDTKHPLESKGFQRGLMAAGYVEPLDLSRKKIKARFVHALSKEKFKDHLDQFLSTKDLKAKNEYMIRFIGQQNVHSPFVHIYTTSLPQDLLPLTVHPEAFDNIDRPSLWTHLRTIKGASHWSCKEKGFWPLRVVLDGPGGEDMIPANTSKDEPATEAVSPPASNAPGPRDLLDDLDDVVPDYSTNYPSVIVTQSPSSSNLQEGPPREELRSSSSRKERKRRAPVQLPPLPPPDLVPDAYNEDEDVTPASFQTPIEPSRAKPQPPKRRFTLYGNGGEDGEGPTVLEAVKQLGESVAKAIPPGLERMTASLEGLRNSWSNWGASKMSEEEQYKAERAQRKAERRARRQAEREREEQEHEQEFDTGHRRSGERSSSRRERASAIVEEKEARRERRAARRAAQ
ncbi:hypothetical protein T439DRAFT_353386 [Meredithblackwellia eburnea MCA 4105]